MRRVGLLKKARRSCVHPAAKRQYRHPAVHLLGGQQRFGHIRHFGEHLIHLVQGRALSVDLLHGGAGVQDKHEISLPVWRIGRLNLHLGCRPVFVGPFGRLGQLCGGRAQSVLLTQVTVLPCVVGGPQRRIPAVLVEAELTVHCSLHQVPYRVVLEKYIAVFQLFQDTRLGPLTDCTPIRHPCDVFEGTHLYGGHPAQVQCSFQPGVSKRLSCNFSCHLGKVKGLQLRTVGKCLFPDFRYLAPFPQDHLL